MVQITKDDYPLNLFNCSLGLAEGGLNHPCMLNFITLRGHITREFHLSRFLVTHFLFFDWLYLIELRPLEHYRCKLDHRIQIYKDDVCKNDTAFDDIQIDICDRFDDQTSKYLLIKNKIHVLTRVTNEKFVLAPIGDVLQSSEFIKEFKFDPIMKRLYILTSTGISFKYYGTKKAVSKIKNEFIVRRPDIIGFGLDHATEYLFYYTKYTIYLVHTRSRFMKTVYSSQCLIYKAGISETIGTLWFSCYAITNASILISLKILTMSGRVILEMKVPDKLRAFKISNDKYYYLFKNHVEMKSISSSDISEIQNLFMETSDAFLYDSKMHITTKHGVFGFKNFVLLKNIRKSHIISYHRVRNVNGCKYATCNKFCFPLSKFEFKCDCQDGWQYDEPKSECICRNRNVQCDVCQKTEFACDNNKCIERTSRCDGIDDCGDNSDERCSDSCLDKYYCFPTKKCLPKETICDERIDCPDGSDEQGCLKVTKTCPLNHFECFNNQCLSMDNTCDLKTDCVDGADEENCDLIICGADGARCDDGQCIGIDQVCDGIFNCRDLSDERACFPRYFNLTFNTLSCMITCESNCIHADNICDHITDCRDGSDEESCGHSSYCPPSKPNICSSNRLCYEDDYKCDGFQDCTDAVDESLCSQYIICRKNEIYKCDGNKKIICMDKVCDSNFDCDDRSDETELCLGKSDDLGVTFNFLDQGRVQIVLNGKINSPTKYDIMILSWKNNTLHFSAQGISQNITVNNHDQCQRYLLKLIKPDNKKFKVLHYTYAFFKFSSPYNLRSDSTNFLLWDTHIPNCVPRTYYIECHKHGQLILKNFTRNPHHTLPDQQRLTCRVV
ncbi:Low-density lipoprotein receptor-related protein 2 [Thelohanellus kitauei]|uniref:Low-density lipoprotein receptor-related protein 2 n=1 Tax=Thelohanellus kitauei TaxID=669202 RepID=A0A0C2M2A4_THEKT|nr:Low-density lipoprotein receptor-related protein 2 [Thelohanellus kitauei]